MLPMLILLFVISSSFHLNLIGTHIVLYNLYRICIDYMELTKINMTGILCHFILCENFSK